MAWPVKRRTEFQRRQQPQRIVCSSKLRGVMTGRETCVPTSSCWSPRSASLWQQNDNWLEFGGTRSSAHVCSALFVALWHFDTLVRWELQGLHKLISLCWLWIARHWRESNKISPKSLRLEGVHEQLEFCSSKSRVAVAWVLSWIPRHKTPVPASFEGRGFFFAACFGCASASSGTVSRAANMTWTTPKQRPHRISIERSRFPRVLSFFNRSFGLVQPLQQPA